MSTEATGQAPPRTAPRRATGGRVAALRPPASPARPPRRPGLQPAALRQLLDLLKNQRRLIGHPRILVPPTHLGEGGIPLFRARVPMNAVPLGPEKLAEGVAGRKADPHPVGAELLDRRNTKVLRLADSHGGAKLTGPGMASQARGRRRPCPRQARLTSPLRSARGGLRLSPLQRRQQHPPARPNLRLRQRIGGLARGDR